MQEHLIIFDTTLRDGEQSPGASMTKEEKVRIAWQLERMGVDVIEAGFPAASNGDFEAVKAVADSVKDSVVCGLARAIEADIQRAGVVTLFAALTMVSNIPYYSGKEINLRRRVPFFTILLLVLFFFVLIPSHPPLVLFCLFTTYAFSGYFIKLWRFGRNKRSSETPNS